jgi:hypothetical protein
MRNAESAARNSEFVTHMQKARKLALPGLFFSDLPDPSDLPGPPTSPTYRSVNVSSIVIRTGTGSPMRVPGAKRHWRAATTAC